MSIFIVHEEISSKYRFHAGSKAREDIETIVIQMGGKSVKISDKGIPDRSSFSIIGKLLSHRKVSMSWRKQLDSIPPDSDVIIQYPVFFHTIYFNVVIKHLHKKGCRVIVIIHDLEILRYAARKERENQRTNRRLALEEKKALPLFDTVIAHNDRMKEVLVKRMGFDFKKIKTIGIFDYIIPEYDNLMSKIGLYKNDRSIIVAGNLNRNKAGYIYKLPENCSFELFGDNYDGDPANNIHYNGRFLPDQLPFHLRGSFGLIWDGPDCTTCSGIWGEYLRFNNPHKTSLYLACGIPVIIWKEAAMADFVKGNNCGVLVQSLFEINDILSTITNDEYYRMKSNAEKIGEKLRKGYYTVQVLSKQEEGI